MTLEILPNKNDLTLSYSRISDFDRNGPKALIKKTIVDNQGIKLGSIVDDLLFDNENFKNKYHVSDLNEPTATLGQLCAIIIDNYTKIPSSEEILEIVKKNNFWSSSKKDETLIKNYDKPEFWNYLDLKFNYADKILVPLDTKLLADELVQILKNHIHSKDYFNNKYSVESQHVFEILYNDVNLRGFIDMIVVNHENKTIKVVDLKTGSSPISEFKSSFVKWRYYLQAAVYSLAIKDIISNTNIKDYEILPFEILYIGTKEKVPAVFEVDQEWIDFAINGFIMNDIYEYRGLDELIEEIKFHHNNKLYDFSKEIYESRGRLKFHKNGLRCRK